MRNIKVKCFENSWIDNLEKKVNEFLENNDYEIIDIKYAGNVSAKEFGIVFSYSCMIIYKEYKLIMETV